MMNIERWVNRMIWVDDKQIKVEHFPDGTQRISIPGVREIAPFAATI